MEHLRAAVLAACCAALALTLAESMLPTEKFHRQIRLMMTLLLLTAVLKPLTGLDFSPLTDGLPADTAAEDFTTLAEQAYTEAVAERIVSSLNEALAEHHVNCTVTALDVHIQTDGSIVINEVVIRGNILTGTVYLREWLGDAVTVTKEDDAA